MEKPFCPYGHEIKGTFETARIIVYKDMLRDELGIINSVQTGILIYDFKPEKSNLYWCDDCKKSMSKDSVNWERYY